MKMTFVVGPPCVGKSSIARALLQIGSWQYCPTKYVPHHHSQDSIALLGRYDEPHQFPGTDRMSMAAQPHVIDWLRNCEYSHVVLEGDRLSNTSMLAACAGADIQVLHVTVPINTLETRRKAERNQPSIFIRSRETKVHNLIRHCAAHAIHVIDVVNDEAHIPFVTAMHIAMR